MPDSPPERLYNEQEISALLRRATQLQASSPDAGGEGLSLGEIERIAADSGIDPLFIRAAAAHVQDGSAERPKRSALYGAPVQVEVERLVRGSLRPDQVEAVVGAIRESLNEAGTVGQLGETVEWASRPSASANVQVTLSQRSGHTRIHLVHKLENHFAAGTTIFGTVLFFAVGNLLGSSGAPYGAEAWLATGGAAAGIAAGLRGAFRWYAGRKEKLAQRLMDRLENVILTTGASEAAAVTSALLPTADEAPTLLPLDSDNDDSASRESFPIRAHV